MTKGHRIMATACGLEAATGLGLLVAPAVVVRPLLGSAIDGTAIVVGNIAGIALVALAIACWPRAEAAGGRTYIAMLVYNLLVALLLAQAGADTAASGILLWPAVVMHGILTILIVLASFDSLRGAAQQL